MDSTQDLLVKPDLFLKNEIQIHPNDGFDIGIMNTSLKVKIFLNSTIEVFNKAEEEFFEGEIVLSNKCINGNIMISKKFWRKLGMPNKVRIFIENDKALVSNS